MITTSVRALARTLHAPANPWKALLMVDCGSYFDDSGTHGTSVVQIIAGYVAPLDAWEKIENPWRKTLSEFQDRGVHCFHATECLAQTGQFERLEKWQCAHVYKQLSDILEGATEVQPIIAAVRSEDWAAIDDVNFKTVFESSYDFCVDRTIQQVVNWSSNSADNSRVPVVIAVQKEHEEEMERTFRSWSKVQVIEDRIGALVFEFPDALVPLQAADMLAHEFYRQQTSWHAMKSGQKPPPEKLHPPVLQKIIKGRPLKDGGLYDRWYLDVCAGGIREKSP